jgi:hypothetical protein
MRCLDLAEAGPMTFLPWRVAGARLHLPRDLEIAYVVGRMGVVTIADAYPLWYGSPHTARFGFGRLARLGLLRPLPRPNVISPAWFTLTSRGLEWTAEQAGCDQRDLRAVGGIRRMNLEAVGLRNRLWTSLVLACRENPAVRLDRVQPEWELRLERTDDLNVVPDVVVSLTSDAVTEGRRCAWMVEMDAGTERKTVLRTKALRYSAFRGVPRLYGHADWRLLMLVPSTRRACTVAAAITSGGAGAFSYVAVAKDLESGHAFERRLWSCSELSRTPQAKPTASLLDGITAPKREADQQGRLTVDRDSSSENGAITP